MTEKKEGNSKKFDFHQSDFFKHHSYSMFYGESNLITKLKKLYSIIIPIAGIKLF